jgi:hypothetical protein
MIPHRPPPCKFLAGPGGIPSVSLHGLPIAAYRGAGGASDSRNVILALLKS